MQNIKSDDKNNGDDADDGGVNINGNDDVS